MALHTLRYKVDPSQPLEADRMLFFTGDDRGTTISLRFDPDIRYIKAQMSVIKADGTTVVTEQSTYADFELTEEMLSCEGRLKIFIHVFDSDLNRLTVFAADACVQQTNSGVLSSYGGISMSDVERLITNVNGLMERPTGIQGIVRESSQLPETAPQGTLYAVGEYDSYQLFMYNIPPSYGFGIWTDMGALTGGGGGGSAQDTGWKLLPTASDWASPDGAPLRIRRTGNVVFVAGRVAPTAAKSGSSYYTVATVPEGYRYTMSDDTTTSIFTSGTVKAKFLGKTMRTGDILVGYHQNYSDGTAAQITTTSYASIALSYPTDDPFPTDTLEDYDPQ